MSTHLPRVHALTVGLLLAGLLVSAAATAQTPPLTVANSGFETVDGASGLPLGWTAWAQPSLSAYTLAMAHSGVACARVTDDSVSVSQGLRCTPVPIEPGKTYEAAVWVKITALQAGGFALYLEYWNGSMRLQNSAVSTSTVGEWTQLKLRAPAPANAKEATLLIYGSSATVGEAYFDDATLTLVE